MTTLTKAALLGKAACRYEEVEIDGWGTVGIRSVSRSLRGRRTAAMMDSSGKVVPIRAVENRTYQIIDQLMVNKEEPMFTEADFAEVVALDDALLEKINDAIDNFNGPVKNEPSESQDTNDN